MKDESFISTQFHYIPSPDSIIPARLIFRANQKRKISVTFDESQGWECEVERRRIPHERDVVLGRLIGDARIFKIKQNCLTIVWRKANISYDDIII